MNFQPFALPDWELGHLGALFACQKAVFWFSSLYHGNKTPVSCLFWGLNVKIVIWQAANS
jgi:hypothetical protein